MAMHTFSHRCCCHKGLGTLSLRRARAATIRWFSSTKRNRCILQISCRAAARCHYKVLGLQRSASADEVKAAFRQLARQLHPDVNPAPEATEAFKQARAAYEVLSDPKQRAAYNHRLKEAAVYSRTGSTGSNRAATKHHTTQSNQGHPSEWYVVYDIADESYEDDDAEPVGGFYGWHQQSGSWQSSWKANRKKHKAQQQQQQQAQQLHHRLQWQQQGVTVYDILSHLEKPSLQVVVQVFGQQLEHLDCFEDLIELLAAVEDFQARGIRLDPNMFTPAASGRTSSSSSSGSSTSSTGRSRAAASSTSNRASNRGRQGLAAEQQASSRASTSTSRSKSTKTFSSQRQRQEQSRSKAGSYTRFDEVTFEDLFDIINDPKQAQAARMWVQNYAAMGGIDPRLAADLEALFTIDFLTQDWPNMGNDSYNRSSVGGGWDPSSGNGERSRYRSKPGLARDYVRYQSEVDDNGLQNSEVPGWWNVFTADPLWDDSDSDDDL